METTEMAYERELAQLRRKLRDLDTLLFDGLSDRLAMMRRERHLAQALGESGQTQDARIQAVLLRAVASDPQHGHLLKSIMATLLTQDAHPTSS